MSGGTDTPTDARVGGFVKRALGGERSAQRTIPVRPPDIQAQLQLCSSDRTTCLCCAIWDAVCGFALVPTSSTFAQSSSSLFSTESVDGLRCTHLPLSSSEASRGLESQMQFWLDADSTSRREVRAWFDAQGRPRQLTATDSVEVGSAAIRQLSPEEGPVALACGRSLWKLRCPE